MSNHIESLDTITRIDLPGKRITSLSQSIADSFWEKTVKTDDGCWLWTGQTHSSGYGRIERGAKIGKTIYLAHRISWVLHHGEIPDGFQVLHFCDNPPCSNPNHLFLGTNRDNHEDKIKKSRQAMGEKSPAAKLTNTAIREIRRRYELGGITQQQLADEFGVANSQINLVIHCKAWKHVI